MTMSSFSDLIRGTLDEQAPAPVVDSDDQDGAARAATMATADEIFAAEFGADSNRSRPTDDDQRQTAAALETYIERRHGKPEPGSIVHALPGSARTSLTGPDGAEPMTDAIRDAFRPGARGLFG